MSRDFYLGSYRKTVEKDPFEDGGRFYIVLWWPEIEDEIFYLVKNNKLKKN
ncbi:MAG: hypothetical protein HQK52_12955 [Oligoflexia bacterium]|nr:hypothetical protein [Oligoflexia bacterium]